MTEEKYWWPKPGEWIWGRYLHSPWELMRFREYKDGYFYCDLQNGGWFKADIVAPFKGELPPGLNHEKEE